MERTPSVTKHPRDALPITRNRVSLERPYATIDEREPLGSGATVSATTVFLTASECPIGCSMCDLWQNTLPTATPPGAIVRQLDHALVGRQKADWLKLYNSGNFFDSRSIPLSDYQAIASRCRHYSRIVVENHPRIGADRLQRFRDLLDAQLEVAVGLETVQPRWLGRLQKKMTRDDFDRYASWLRQQQVDLRVFLIVGMPGISVAESIQWAELSARHAAWCGTRHISLIPARSGHGWNGLSHLLPVIDAGALDELHEKVIDRLREQCVVTVDVWDMNDEQAVVKRIAERNLSQSTLVNSKSVADEPTDQ